MAPEVISAAHFVIQLTHLFYTVKYQHCATKLPFQITVIHFVVGKLDHNPG
jgi:hypothetical protein